MNRIPTGTRVSFLGCSKGVYCSSCGYTCFSRSYETIIESSKNKKIYGMISERKPLAYDYSVKVTMEHNIVKRNVYVGVNHDCITIESKFIKHIEALNGNRD